MEKTELLVETLNELLKRRHSPFRLTLVHTSGTYNDRPTWQSDLNVVVKTTNASTGIIRKLKVPDTTREDFDNSMFADILTWSLFGKTYHDNYVHLTAFKDLIPVEDDIKQ